jgi:hypothetical protein
LFEIPLISIQLKCKVITQIYIKALANTGEGRGGANHPSIDITYTGQLKKKHRKQVSKTSNDYYSSEKPNSHTIGASGIDQHQHLGKLQ